MEDEGITGAEKVSPALSLCCTSSVGRGDRGPLEHAYSQKPGRVMTCFLHTLTRIVLLPVKKRTQSFQHRRGFQPQKMTTIYFMHVQYFSSVVYSHLNLPDYSKNPAN